MNQKKMLLVAIWVFALVSPFGHADTYSDALVEFKKSAEVASFLDSAYGYALYPTVGKGGVGIGGAHGKGKVFRGGQAIGASKVTQLTIGFQLGGQAFSQIIFFENKAALDKFTKGNFEFNAQATAIAITANVNAQSGTTGNSVSASSTNAADVAKAKYSYGMVVFTVAKGGLMYEASIGGQKFSFDASDN